MEPEPEPAYVDTGEDVSIIPLNLFMYALILGCMCRFGAEVHRCWRDFSGHAYPANLSRKTIHTNLLTDKMLAEGGLTECAICLEEFQKNDGVANLPCNHLFHISCVQEWFKNNTTCPICRDNVCSYITDI
jgi:hypothetical protein